MKFFIHTLGCKVNQYETQAMEQILAERGHILSEPEDNPDVCIINTCTVTAVSDKKSRQLIRRLKRGNPNAVIAVCGCYAQTKPEDILSLDVDVVSGTGDRIAFLDAIEQAVKARGQVNLVDEIRRHTVFEELPAGGLSGRTRAMLKVEDGCLNFCTYCIIPYARGPVRSLPLKEAVEETKHLAEEGYREITITGIEISSWGQDLRSGETLADLIEAVCSAAPSVRIRLGSLEPRTITEEFCSRLSKLPNLCPHFHPALQSGCDATLKRMNRHYTTQEFLNACALLRKYFEHPAITTDMIVGFPGETEEEFADTLGFMKKAAFSAMHIFPYSRRTGTPAAKMPGQIENSVKERRAAEAGELASELEMQYLREHLGKTVEVLFEEKAPEGLWRGHTPDYIEVHADGENLHNMLLPVRIERAGSGILYGTTAEGGE